MGSLEIVSGHAWSKIRFVAIRTDAPRGRGREPSSWCELAWVIDARVRVTDSPDRMPFGAGPG